MHYKKLQLPKLALIVLLGCALATPTQALVGGPTLMIQLNPSTITTNGQFTASVYIDTKTYSVAATELHLVYPADKLQALAITSGAFLPTELSPGSIGSGTATITVASGMTAKQGAGILAVVTFKALAAGTAQINFATSTQVAAPGQTGNVVDTMTPSSVTISSTGTTGGMPTPTPTPTSTPTPTGIIFATPIKAPTISAVGTISTGPGKATILALVLSSLVSLLYVGYTHTNSFRRHEAEEIAADERQHPSDFKP